MSRQASAEANEQAASGEGRRCVVVARGGDGPAALLGSLAGRGLAVELAEGPAEVMVALAQAEGPAVVVIVEPGQFNRVGELVTAIRRYYPKTACWRYDGRGTGAGRLANINGDLSEAAGLSGEVQTGGEAQVRGEAQAGGKGQVMTRLDLLLAKAPERRSGGRAGAGMTAMISAEELMMLIGPGPGDAAEAQGDAADGTERQT